MKSPYLTVDEVARSFLVSEAAMAKRLVRAKYKIKAAGTPYRVPAAPELPDRLRSVLSVVYLIYNTGADDTARASLRGDALRLSRDRPTPQTGTSSSVAFNNQMRGKSNHGFARVLLPTLQPIQPRAPNLSVGFAASCIHDGLPILVAELAARAPRGFLPIEVGSASLTNVFDIAIRGDVQVLFHL